MKKVFFSTLIFIFLTGCSSYRTRTITLPDGFKVQARVADTPATHQKGLMFVTDLPENHGMLFVFDQEQEQLFWMKNTLIDLDMVFIGADKKVTSVAQQVPHSYTYTPDHEVATAAGIGQYVLELRAQTAAKHGVIPGAMLQF